MTTSNEKNTATLIHLSALAQYIVPFGNYIFPTMIWSAKKNESEFVDYNGKQVLNFQLSILIYTIVLCAIAIPILIYAVFKNLPHHANLESEDFIYERILFGENSSWAIIGIVGVLIIIFIKIIEFVLIIHAAVKASNGDFYKYPLSISFFK
jgi:uncharacterized Tic20 family protein